MFSGQRYFIDKPIAFIGFMGAGKTSCAQLLSDHTGISWVDIDKEIVNITKKTISEIINNYGESDFRKIESDVLQRVIESKKQIIATGGGIVDTAVGRGLLKQCFCIWLKVDAPEAQRRIYDSASRPLFKDLENAENLIKVRDEHYEQFCDISIDTMNQSVTDIVAQVMDVLIKENVLQY